MVQDPASIAGKTLTPDEHTDLLVIGAGPAGLAAAIAAAQDGARVVLVDENPVPANVMADDIPLFFGNRMSGAARNDNAMMQAFIASDPAIAAAFDAGVDVRLGTIAWGIYAPGPSVGWLPGPVAGLADATRAWMIAAERITVATGRRDMGLAFPGWELAGVLGMTAALRLATRYGALDARRAVVLGSTAEALDGARQLAAAGIDITAVIETGPASVAPGGEFTILADRMIRRAEGDASGVTALVVVQNGTDIEERIACDAIILAIATVPVIELLDAAGCRTAFSAAAGAHIPVLDALHRTTIPAISAIGDCAGTDTLHDSATYRMDWVRATLLAAMPGVEPFVCRCEEVTAREILEVRPPRYLDWPDDRRNRRDLRDLLGDGAPNPDQVKRLTRAGMGVCQGRRCREQVACLLALGAGTRLDAIPLATHRAPVRPLSLAQIAGSEDAGMATHWDTWFGMKSQYIPFWKIDQPYTAATRNDGGEVASE